MTAGDADYQVQFEQAGARLCSLCGSVDARCRRRHLDVSYEMTRLNRSGEEKLFHTWNGVSSFKPACVSFRRGDFDHKCLLIVSSNKSTLCVLDPL